MQLAGYRDIVPVGHGGMGDVYRGVRVSTSVPVGIKVLRDVADRSVAWLRARRELEALATLKGHPHVIQIEEILDVDGIPVLIMEFAPGGSLADLLARRRDRLSIGESILIGIQVSDALVAAHALGILHRDIKPQNVIIGPFGQAKVCDFGIAALARSAEFSRHTSAISVQYASPEELDSSPDVGPPSDVFSLGATLAHCLAGEPWRFADRGSVHWLPESWRWPEGVDHQTGGRFVELVDACLEAEPRRRPTASELRRQLEDLEAGIGSLRVRTLEFADPHTSSTGSGITSARWRFAPQKDDEARCGARPQLPSTDEAPRDWWTA